MKDLQISFDIDLLNAPCELLDVRYVTNHGRDNVLRSQHLEPNGSLSAVQTGNRHLEQIIDHIKNKGGCKISGTIYKHHLMDHFFILYARGFLFDKIANDVPEFRMDLSHRINQIRMGDISLHMFFETYTHITKCL